MSTDTFEFRPSGHIEFEHVELEPEKAKTAAAPVDETIDNDPLSINFGRKKDHKPAAAERMLAGATIDWLVAFAADMRPKALCERYPHVANRLAQGWSQAARSMAASLTATATYGPNTFACSTHRPYSIVWSSAPTYAASTCSTSCAFWRWSATPCGPEPWASASWTPTVASRTIDRRLC